MLACGHDLFWYPATVLALKGEQAHVVLDDGKEQQRYHLNRSYFGLYIAPMVWRQLDNFSSGSVCLALASASYDENDYFREYQAFLQAIRRPAWRFRSST